MFNTKHASQEMSAVFQLFSLSIKILHTLQKNTSYFKTLLIFLFFFNLMFAIPKCLTHIEIYNNVSVKHIKTLLFWRFADRASQYIYLSI